jgi:hypothetical protein
MGKFSYEAYEAAGSGEGRGQGESVRSETSPAAVTSQRVSGIRSSAARGQS